jgi:hypothetical protein
METPARMPNASRPTVGHFVPRALGALATVAAAWWPTLRAKRQERQRDLAVATSRPTPRRPPRLRL